MYEMQYFNAFDILGSSLAMEKDAEEMKTCISLLYSEMRAQFERRLKDELHSEMLNMVREELAQHDKKLKKREKGLERQINKVDEKMNKTLSAIMMLVNKGKRKKKIHDDIDQFSQPIEDKEDENDADDDEDGDSENDDSGDDDDNSEFDDD
ncbi:kinesin-related protein 4-like [Punica granatum]|uniref:Uncharacterized protein n=2 Tax=Punica granatum TaxID=22663 RepID=A0A2I0KUV3_PUNGR|nr:kinesin-related protein 4-like [Punica granatum]PKI72241.1 hypothetical protein CRG98_007378 [Punica granatum]